MIPTRAKLASALLLGAAAVALMASGPHPDQELRVCADPFDLPFSNDQEQGFENKIAHVVAQDLNARVINYWWPSRRGVLRNSILGGFCDVMIQAPVGLDPVATTKPYYRSTYYFVYRTDRGLQLRSLDDTILKHLKLGVNMIGYDYTDTPPAHAASWAWWGSGTSSIPIPTPTTPKTSCMPWRGIRSPWPSCGDPWRAIGSSASPCRSPWSRCRTPTPSRGCGSRSTWRWPCG